MTSLRLLRKLLWTTDWRVFAAIAAALILTVAVPLLTTPGIFEIPSYRVLRGWASASAWGTLGFVLAGGVIVLLDRPVAAWLCLGLVVYALLLALGFFFATGPTAGLFAFSLDALLAVWAFLRSDARRGT